MRVIAELQDYNHKIRNIKLWWKKYPSEFEFRNAEKTSKQSLQLTKRSVLENFKTTESLAASLASVEGAGAVVGGILISSLRVYRPRLIFVLSTAFFLFLLVLIGNSPFILGLIGMLFLAGMLSSIYSSMQSTLIYRNSIDDLRSPTLSLMTLFIGTGIVGALNVSWMGLHMTVSNVITLMALEGLVIFLLMILFLRYLNETEDEV